MWHHPLYLSQYFISTPAPPAIRLALRYDMRPTVEALALRLAQPRPLPAGHIKPVHPLFLALFSARGAIELRPLGVCGERLSTAQAYELGAPFIFLFAPQPSPYIRPFHPASVTAIQKIAVRAVGERLLAYQAATLPLDWHEIPDSGGIGVKQFLHCGFDFMLRRHCVVRVSWRSHSRQNGSISL